MKITLIVCAFVYGLVCFFAGLAGLDHHLGEGWVSLSLMIILLFTPLIGLMPPLLIIGGGISFISLC
ncbi:MAG: hypothetical protein M2R45_04399 [Verrucomicrobia subdivision 3 bacterium]|nr:hypothetical protein [Limisphaerales bacterium]MCS1417263.1 hypothetical protein [Limisphaerales bacterium]